MLEESKRQAYLSAMGITQWQLRSDENAQLATAVAQLPESEPEPVTKANIDTSSSRNSDGSNQEIKQENITSKVKGLRLLNQASKNGLLVILSEQRKNLSPENRMMISKMLKGIHFLPAETGFAVISEQDVASSETVSLETIKAILVLGYEAGRQLVKVSGARIIPGTENYTLNSCHIVVSWHPEELHNKPEYKQQAWNDLKQLVYFFNNS